MVLETVGRFLRKHPWWSHFYIRAWNFTKRRTLLPALPTLENFWEWMTFDSSFWTAWDGCFWRISISHHSNFFQLLVFIMQHLMLIKKILQIALSEPTPYRINMPVSFLEDLTQIIFNDSLKYNQQLTSTVDQLLKLYTTRFYVQEIPMQLVKLVKGLFCSCKFNLKNWGVLKFT